MLLTETQDATFSTLPDLISDEFQLASRVAVELFLSSGFLSSVAGKSLTKASTSSDALLLPKLAHKDWLNWGAAPTPTLKAIFRLFFPSHELLHQSKSMEDAVDNLISE